MRLYLSNSQDEKNRIAENEILKELNYIRTQPQDYLKNVVEKTKNQFIEGDYLTGYNELVEELKVLKFYLNFFQV